MSTFKIIGLLLVFSSSSFLGFYKSNRLLKRCEALSELCISLDKLAKCIKCGTSNLQELLTLCFNNKVFLTQKGCILNDDRLSKDDKKLFEKLISEMGISNKESEIKNVSLYNALFRKKLKEAEQDAERLAKLYNSLGMLIGVSVCIFLI